MVEALHYFDTNCGVRRYTICILAVVVLAAPCVVTYREFEQESAEAIVGEGSHPKGAWVTGNEPGE